MARWLLFTVAGGVLIVAGIVMFFTPGPGWAAIALGLWLWSKQFQWARRALDHLVDWLHTHRQKLPDFVARRIDDWQRRREELREIAEQRSEERRRAEAEAEARAEAAVEARRVAMTDGDAAPEVGAEVEVEVDVRDGDAEASVTRGAGTSAAS